MTTILADFRLGVMIADSNISDGDRVWIGRKVLRCRGALIGFAGSVNEATAFMDWWRKGCNGHAPKFSQSDALVLSDAGLIHFNLSGTPTPVKSGIEAIGSGSKAAMCAYEALA